MEDFVPVPPASDEEAIERAFRLDELLEWFSTVKPECWTEDTTDMYVDATREYMLIYPYLRENGILS